MIENATKVFLLVCLLFVCNVGSAQSNYYSMLTNKSYAERSLLFDTVVLKTLIKLPKDIFDVEINALQQQAKVAKDHNVLLEAILGKYQYYDLNSIDCTDEKVRIYESELKKLNKTKDKEYAAILMFELGNNYSGKLHDHAKAFTYYINAEDIIATLDHKKFPDKKRLLISIANRYYNIGDYTKAKHLLFQAYTLPIVVGDVVMYNNKNTLGLIYRHYKNYDSAIYFFEETAKEARNDGSYVWEAIATGNIGICYYVQHKYKEAIPYLMKDVQVCLSYDRTAYDNGMHSLLILGESYLHLDSMSKVEWCLQKAQYYIDSTKDKIMHLASLYPVLARYNNKLGNYKLAYNYLDSAQYYKDSVISRDNIYKLAQVAHKLEVEKHMSVLQQLDAEKELIARTRNGIIIGIVFLFIIITLIINRQRLKTRLHNKELELEKRLAEQQLQSATTQLENITDSISKKNSLLEQSKKEIESLREKLSAAEQEEADVDILNKLHTATILTDQEWDEYKQIFEQVYKGYLIRLRDKLPELSPADTRYIVLSKLKMSNKEMAAILGVQPDTIRTYKHRLRKKINLSEDASITDFADSI